MSDFTEHALNFDSLYLRTFVDLLRKPGIVCREYIEGKRKQYANPLRFMAMAVIIDIFARNIFKIRSPNRSAAGFEETVIDFSLQFPLLASLIIAAPIAFVLSRIYRQTGFNFLENYIFFLYISAQSTILTVILEGTAKLLIGYNVKLVQIFTIVFFVSYFLYAAKKFYGLKLPRFLRGVLIGIGILLGVLLLVFLVGVIIGYLQ